MILVGLDDPLHQLVPDDILVVELDKLDPVDVLQDVADMNEMRGLKRDHLGIDEVTDVLSFPIDGREDVPEGVPRALGDVVICPQVVGEEWRWPLTHGLLHLLGYDHGDAMEAREQDLLA